MNLRSLVAAGLGLAALAAPASGQEPARAPAGKPASREPSPTAVHLVGHEDAELLRRIQDVIDDHDPRKLRSPYVEAVEHDDLGRPTRWAVRRPDLVQFIQDADAAVALGKAFFWEMQAGSDFRRVSGAHVGTACASCHYRFGADARDTNSVRIPYVAWDEYQLDCAHPDLGLGERQQPVDGLAKMVRENQERRRLPETPAPAPAPPDAAGVATLHVDHAADLKAPDPRRFPSPARRRPPGLGDDDEDDDEGDDFRRPRTPLSLIVGSQGVEPRVFMNLVKETSGPVDWWSERSLARDPRGFNRPPQWSMFVQKPKEGPPRSFRQITTRNSPSVFNATFADRLFHDARAESTFNGFSIFGDFDDREVLYVRRVDPKGRLQEAVKARVAITRAALASQAVGPIVNDVEMSYVGRSFHDLAAKLLDTPILARQVVSKEDSVLGRYRSASLMEEAPGLGVTYRQLIEKAFRREWWDGRGADGKDVEVPLLLSIADPDEAPPQGSLMQADFSLYWGLSLMLYQSILVSNESPYDKMLRGDGKAVDALWQSRRGELEPVFLDRVRSTARKPEDCVPGETSKPGQPKPVTPPPSTWPFEFKSGSEVFQRGLRSFLSRGCVDCHDGPLLSEAYSRSDQEENEPLKPVPIGRQVASALLPNSRGDAIAFRYVGARGRAYERIGSIIADGGPETSHGELMDFANVFERIGGDERALARALRSLLAPRLPADRLEAVADAAAKEWITFEKTAVHRLGNRPFFNEDERIARAALIGDPLMVESMPIPDVLAAIRPRLPLNGRLARRPYAFYDASIYALGAGLPRYDRGGGEWTELIEPEVEYPEEVVADFRRFLDGLEKSIQERRGEVPAPAQAALDELVEEKLRGFDRESRSGYGLVAPRLVREAVRAMARDDEESRARVQRLHGMIDLATKARAAGPEAAAMTGQEEGVASLPFRRSSRHASAGAPGRAYQIDPESKAGRPRRGREPRAGREAAPRPARRPGVGPWRTAADADAEARAGNPRDLSWHRNLPNWDDSPELGPDNAGFDSVDARRADLHFFARSRAMVQDESPEGRRKPLMHDDELAFWGSFKTPTLRNVALTAPYMHNGRLQSLLDVVDFYDRGGDVPADPVHNPDLAPAMIRMGMNDEEKIALVFFLMCLTDHRVEYEKAPFDHPSLRLVNGYEADLRERIVSVEAVGRAGERRPPRGFPDHGDVDPDSR